MQERIRRKLCVLADVIMILGVAGVAVGIDCVDECTKVDVRNSTKTLCILDCERDRRVELERKRALVKESLSPPLVLPCCVSPTSVHLQIPEIPPNVTIQVQTNVYGSGRGSDPASSVRRVNNTVLQVDGLQPYTTYEFRLVYLLTEEAVPVISPPTNPVRTLAQGPPTSPPIVTSVSALEPRRISISWRAPEFQNGEIINYHLKFWDADLNTEVQVKDLDGNSSFYIIPHRMPSTNYSISISARNKDGYGPEVVVFVKTEPLVKQTPDIHSQYLLFAVGNSVMKQNISTHDDPKPVVNITYEITALDVMEDRNHLFISSSNGDLFEMELRDSSPLRTLLKKELIGGFIAKLSVDWLNDWVYFAVVTGASSFGLTTQGVQEKTSYSFARCTITGKNLTFLQIPDYGKIVEFKVDPYNGYLFWVVEGRRGGIYRHDLADLDLSTNPPLPRRIVSENNLGPFHIDYVGQQILIVHQLQSTVLSYSFEGDDMANFRSNVQTSNLHNVTSLTYNGTYFLWSLQDEIYKEELHNSIYFHNHMYSTDGSPISALVMVRESGQPYPVPTQGVENLEVVFGYNSCSVTWLPSPLLPSKGRGAWSKWLYEVNIEAVEHGFSQGPKIHDSPSTELSTQSLTPGVDYMIAVRPYSMVTVTADGVRNKAKQYGPMSPFFRGRTFSDEGMKFILAGVYGVFETGVSSEDVRVVMPASSLRVNGSLVAVADVVAAGDAIYLLGNDSHVFKYDDGKKDLQIIDGIHATAICYERMANKLYWSSARSHRIIRTSLETFTHETEDIVALAGGLICDSNSGMLFWSTSYAVEGSRLNGEERKQYFKVDFMSGKLIVGLAFDDTSRTLFWMVRSFNSLTLHSHHLGTGTNFSNSLPKAQYGSPLIYVDHRLMWIGGNTVYYSDLSGMNVASRPLYHQQMTALTVASASRTPAFEVKPPKVNPPILLKKTSVNRSRISWSVPFSETWLNNVTIQYEVVISNTTDSVSQVTTGTSVSLPVLLHFEPFSVCRVSIRPFTYWAKGEIQNVDLMTDEAQSSPPYRGRAFVERSSLFDAAKKQEIVLRWNPPLHPNGRIISYIVRGKITLEDDSVQSVNWPYANISELRIPIETTNSYTIEIQAVNGGGISDPLVYTVEKDLQPLRHAIIATEDSIALVDLDLAEMSKIEEISSASSIETRIRLSVPPTALAYLNEEKTVFWANEQYELWSATVPGPSRKKLQQLSGQVTAIAVDWTGRTLYLSMIDQMDSTSVLHKLDLVSGNLTVTPSFSFKFKTSVDSLHVDPFTRTLFAWSTTSPHKIALQTFNLAKPEEHPTTTFHSFKEDICGSHLIYSSNGSLVLFESCKSFNLYNISGGSETEGDFNDCFLSEKKLVLKRGGERVELSSQNAGIKWVVGLTGSQPYPDLDCLVPTRFQDETRVIDKSAYHADLALPNASYPSPCPTTSLPTPIYTLLYGEKAKCSETKIGCGKVMFHQSVVRLSGLQPYTEYAVYIVVGNFYSGILGKEGVNAGPYFFRTNSAAPSPVRSLRATVASPSDIQLFWERPEKLNGDSVKYSILFEKDVAEGRKNTVQHSTENATFSVTDLEPETVYKLKVQSCSELSECSTPVSINTKTLAPPGSFELAQAGSEYLRIHWLCENFSVLESYLIQYRESGSFKNATKHQAILRQGNDFVPFEISGLKPKTQFSVRVIAYHKPFGTPYIWPRDDRFRFETLAATPGPPGRPIVLKDDGFPRLVWEPATSNGAIVTSYEIQARSLSDPLDGAWEVVNRTSDTKWRIAELGSKDSYVFRIRALNSVGWGAVSQQSEEIQPVVSSEPFGGEFKEEVNLAMVISVASLMCVFLISAAGAYFVIYFRRRQKLLSTISKSSDLPGADFDLSDRHELANLRELPRVRMQQINSLYSPFESQLFNNLEFQPPLIKRDDLNLTNFLGSGAFGEVFEGEVRNMGDMAKVAVKTLRKGSSEQEKLEFMKEAELMGKFQHEHILKMLGYCFDDENVFILMELMEGDLLSFLRGHRPSEGRGAPLSLVDLVNMCIDVAKGCCYLEELHFVHRDLAARNCLISASESRVVKIGDFGLARDIYRNDYYRKEGEGLLPVRWMSPESLVDGVFTTQSDVWSFGILLWEIMTYGQQPYPARTNLEVLTYVRTGGRLSRPQDCPNLMFELMQSCWAYEPSERPTFQHCLNQLLFLKMKLEESASAQYGVSHGVDNEAFSTEDVSSKGHSASKESLSTTVRADSAASTARAESHGEESSLSDEPSPSRPAFPKYLELLDNDGYEVPVSLRHYSAPRRPTCAVNPTYNHRHSLTFPYVNENIRNARIARALSTSFTDIAYIPCRAIRDDGDPTRETSALVP